MLLTAAGMGQTARISGIVLHNNLPVPDALIIISDSGKFTRLLSNNNGRFDLPGYRIKSDSILISVSKSGYFPVDIRTSDPILLEKLSISLSQDSMHMMDEVRVTSKNVTITANKRSYRVNSKNFISNAKSTAVIPTIPDLTIVNGNILLENRKNVIVFIDGMESTMQDLERLGVEDIDRIEVLPNPSAVFGSEESTAVLQIVTKKKPETFIRGEINAYAGVRLGSRGYTPSLAFKSKKIYLTAFFGYGTNNQNITNNLTRRYGNEELVQHSYRKVRGWQKYLSSRLRITLNTKSSLHLGANLFAYSFNGDLNGFASKNSTESQFSVRDKEKLDKWFVSGIYNYVISPKSDFYIKTKYFDYRNSNQNWYNQQGAGMYSNIFSNTKEFSAEMLYSKKNLKPTMPIEYSAGLKNIYRQFYLQDARFNISQYINSGYLNASIEFSKRLSMSGSVAGEVTSNRNDKVNQDYFNFLPTLSLLNKANEKTNLTLEYSKRITRPGSNYLNPDPIFFDPSNILVGNTNLLPQLRHSLAIAIQKQINGTSSFSFRLYGEKISNSIVESFTEANNVILTTYQNAGKARVIGAYSSLTTQAFKKLSVNLSAGMNHNSFSSKANALVRENEGFSFNGSIYLSAMVKKILSLSLNGSVNTPYYSLIRKRTSYPQLGFSAETSALKKKLNIRLSYANMFALNVVSRNYVRYENFLQFSDMRNNDTNLTLTLIYRFGKQFSGYRAPAAIRTDDIINK